MIDKIRPYGPLLIVLAISLLTAFVQQGFDWMALMHQSMGYFLILLAILKIFDLRGFRTAFLKYDLVTQKFHVYGLIYPFVELGLGLMYVGFIMPMLTYVLTIAIMGVAAAGVINSIRQGKTLNCACMGNVLAVPLSTVSIIENIGMVVMALLMLINAA